MVRRGQIKPRRTQNFRQPKIYLQRKERQKKDYSHFWSLFSFKKVIFLLVLILIVWWIFFSKSFAVKDVIVEGNNLIPTDKITNEIPKDRNIFLVSNTVLEKNIKTDIPEVNQVQVYKGYPDAIKVVVIEYDQSLIWKSGQSYYLLDSQGRVYKDVSQDLAKFASLPTVEDLKQAKFDLGQQIVSAGFVAFVENVYSNVAETANLHPDHFSITETTFDLVMYTKEGIYVKFDTSRSSKKQLDDLKNVMIQKLGDIHEYVDIRVDGWAYYK